MKAPALLERFSVFPFDKKGAETFPTFAGFKQIPLTPVPLPEPIQAEITFLGGPFDGHKSTATVKCELTDAITVIMKKSTKHKRVNRYRYRYAGNNTFQYEGKVKKEK